MRFFLCLIVVISIFPLEGCSPLIVGGALGAIGGYAISKDTLQAETERDFDSLWDKSLELLSSEGIIESQNKRIGFIKAKLDHSQVNLRLKRLTPHTTRIRVSARKYLLPDISLAQEILIRILQKP